QIQRGHVRVVRIVEPGSGAQQATWRCRMRVFFHLLRQIATGPGAWQGKLRAIILRRGAPPAMALCAMQVNAGAQPTTTPAKSPWGKTNDGAVEIYTLTNVHGVEARVTTYGATLVSLKAPDRAGQLQNIVLGFDRLEAYLAGVPYYGA